MAPRFLAVAGPLDGTVLPIGEVQSIGRDPSNSFAIADPGIAPQQCLIATLGDVHRLTHLGGHLSTFVNGLPVNEADLRHGDHVKIGVSTFLVLLDAVPHLAPCAGHFGELVPGSVLQFRRDRALDPRAKPSPSAAARLHRALDAALKIGAVLGSVQSVARPLLGLIFEVIPADRAAVLLAEGDPPRFDSLLMLDRDGSDRPAPLEVCRSIAETALHQGVPLLSNDVRAVGAVESSGDHARAVLAAPMHLFGRAFGVIYLEAAQGRFEEDHLQLLALIGEMAAMVLDNCRHVERVESENHRLHAEIGGAHDMVGDSPAMQEIYRFITRVSATDATVLIAGESGTGKELVARAIHRNSRRAAGPFVAINCSAITETLLESELFGHEKGAFTGAVSRKRGKLEVAHGGTVFLDEISELSLSLQPKLLRALEERQFERVGGLEPIKVDIRVIAATNVVLAEAVAARRFRSDLYYRLNVVSTTLPPLRARREDIHALAAHFARRHGEKLRGRLIGITPAAEALMRSYSWPGNVRELDNAIERALVLGASERIGPEDLPDALIESRPPGEIPLSHYHELVHKLKRDLIVQAVARSGGNLTSAAKELGLNANYMHRLIRNMNLRAEVKSGHPTASI